MRKLLVVIIILIGFTIGINLSRDQKGFRTYQEVLTAQQSLLEAEVQQLQTRFERIQSVIKLYHVLGGGM